MQELVEELGIYMLFFDRAGYGDSDANPKQLADVVGCSMGGYPAWSCLNYIPHRSVKDSSLHTTISVQVIDQLVCSEWVARSLQAGRSGSGRAGGELLVAAACQRVEDRVREARRPGP
jgi:hypothetical protein